MMRELGQSISPLTVVDHFDGLLTGFVLDQQDAVIRDAVDLPTLVTNTLMSDLASKVQLAKQVLDFGLQLVPKNPPAASKPIAYTLLSA